MPEDAQEPGRGHLHPQSKARNLVEQDGSRGLHTFFQLQVNDDAAHRREAVRAVERALVCAHHPLLSLLHRRVMRPHKAVQPFACACVAPDVLGIVVAMQHRLHGLLCVSLAGNDTIKGPHESIVGLAAEGYVGHTGLWARRDVGVYVCEEVEGRTKADMCDKGRGVF